MYPTGAVSDFKLIFSCVAKVDPHECVCIIAHRDCNVRELLSNLDKVA